MQRIIYGKQEGSISSLCIVRFITFIKPRIYYASFIFLRDPLRSYITLSELLDPPFLYALKEHSVVCGLHNNILHVDVEIVLVPETDADEFFLVWVTSLSSMSTSSVACSVENSRMPTCSSSLPPGSFPALCRR